MICNQNQTRELERSLKSNISVISLVIICCTISHCLNITKSPTNPRHLWQIGARSREWKSCSVNYQRSEGSRDLRSSPMRCWHPGNIWHAKYLELSVIHNPAVWMSSDWKIHWRWPTANERARYRAAGSSGRTFFFYKAIKFSVANFSDFSDPFSDFFF